MNTGDSSAAGKQQQTNSAVSNGGAPAKRSALDEIDANSPSPKKHTRTMTTVENGDSATAASQQLIDDFERYGNGVPARELVRGNCGLTYK